MQIILAGTPAVAAQDVTIRDQPLMIRPAAAPPRQRIREAAVITLFELGREVTSVLDLDELLQKIPQLIARITKFQAFAVLPARSEAPRS